MSKKSLIYKVGVTPDGLSVMAGIYREHETHGIPLSLLLTLLKEKNMIASVPALYIEARAAGRKHERVMISLEKAFEEAYGEKWTIEALPKLEAYIKLKPFLQQTKSIKEG